MCVNFEETEYVKGNLDYTDLSKPRSKNNHQSTKTIEPKKTTERIRLYGWCLLMFQNDVPNRMCLVSDGYQVIKELKSKLKAPVKVNVSDDLEKCINTIFGNGDLVNNVNNDNIDDEDGVANDSEIVEIMHDDYNYSNTNTVIDETEDSSTVNDNTANTTAVVNKLGLCNIFDCGHTNWWR